ncbi:MAG TPA: hypothetical protein VK186_16185, partial [Candidatus Deferrimicrobium sp.]|nr:hypothetical protein [Candidatus Deferrimicrobium sp.]
MTVAAQINPVYQELQKNRKGHSKTKFGENQHKAKIDFMIDMGYDDSTAVRLKKINIDVNDLRTKMQLNEKEKVVFSDCIVIGTVVKIEHPVDTPRAKIEYATIASVKPEEFLRNDYHLGQAEIPVIIISGPIGNGLEIIEAGEETLQLG